MVDYKYNVLCSFGIYVDLGLSSPYYTSAIDIRIVSDLEGSICSLAYEDLGMQSMWWDVISKRVYSCGS
jgi:hypothetical protein